MSCSVPLAVFTGKHRLSDFIAIRLRLASRAVVISFGLPFSKATTSYVPPMIIRLPPASHSKGRFHMLDTFTASSQPSRLIKQLLGRLASPR